MADLLDLLHISFADQALYGFAGERLMLRCPVSTALAGPGERQGSGCTPRGLHQVRAKIGDGLPAGAVLSGRRWTGEVWTPELHGRFPGRDWILTRILWLSGCEPGVNRLGPVDTFRRYIYLHGTPDCEPMGIPLSHGCVRLRNADLLALFPRVPLHCRVRLDESPQPLWRTAAII
ncbi:L,D-transpeptidase [Pseudomonas panipatensis]|uniref:L,D-transpeptidase catalytic domain n=1 Tax=Pseudomonas panipatensis TaxID=428992 RepID=A0A1G8CFZ0_9PSED|nr:L,D-transpeptidase [Pseudomonas panipatensis]SDH44289.1 L,D-transpeptidase catalytic domain [Pseudomonas panipatensis]SMP64803.1 L,D-transpeptidase catalytic domain [Pseudomonas panipatensis]